MEQNMKTNFTRHFFIDLAKEWYCKYYRIAHEAYDRYFERFDTTRKKRTLPNGVPLELQDVAYYNMV